MKTLTTEKKTRICCERCNTPIGPAFGKPELAEKWFEGSLSEDDIKMNCFRCKGSGEVEHECNCPKCLEFYEDCPECGGSGIENDAKGQDKPIGFYLHKTLLDRAYCPQCTEAMIQERKRRA